MLVLTYQLLVAVCFAKEHTLRKWFYSTDGGCNSDDVIQVNTDMLVVQVGHVSAAKPAQCDLLVKLLDKESKGAYVELSGEVACGNKVHIIGYCGSLHCEEKLFSCSTDVSEYIPWDRVSLLRLRYSVTNTTLKDDFKVNISPEYEVVRRKRGIVKKLAKGVVIVIVVVVVVIVLCAVGIPALICCFCKNRGSSRGRAPPDDVRYVNPATPQPGYPVYPVYPVVQQRPYY